MASSSLFAPRFLLAALALALGSVTAAQAASAVASGVRFHPQAVVVNSTQAQAGHLSVQVWLNKDLGGVGMSQYSVGDELHVGVQVTQDAYIYLFNISGNGKVTLFMPNGYDAPRGNFVKAGSKVTFPQAGAKYTLKVGGPLGQNRVVVLASKQPLGLGALVTAAQGFYAVNASGEQLGSALSSVLGGLSGSDWASTYTWYGVGEPGNGNEELSSLLAESTPAGAAVTAPTLPKPAAPQPVPAIFQAGELGNHTVNPVLRGAYNRTPLGLATNAAWPFDGGLMQTFKGADGSSGAALFMAPGARVAYALSGKLLGHYFALSGLMSSISTTAAHVPAALGWPAGDQMNLPKNSFGHAGSAAAFQRGGLYSSALGTFWLGGEVYKKYLALGGPRSALGWPTADQVGGVAQFEGGTLRLLGGSVQVIKK